MDSTTSYASLDEYEAAITQATEEAKGAARGKMGRCCARLRVLSQAIRCKLWRDGGRARQLARLADGTAYRIESDNDMVPGASLPRWMATATAPAVY